jgi:5-methylcytosine-specific restriction endonuclease McrA
VQLVERAKALLSHAHSKSSLEQIHLRAMRLLVAELEGRRFAKTTRARRPAERNAAPTSESSESSEPRGPRHQGRHIPAATTRAVYERDEARCSYVDARGQRCRETHRLELHHLEPFARGGAHAPENLTLRCRAHNGLAAEEDFGRARMEDAKASRRHESFTAQQDGGPAVRR